MRFAGLLHERGLGLWLSGGEGKGCIACASGGWQTMTTCTANTVQAAVI